MAILFVPPLREREGDLGLLIDHLLGVVNNKLNASKEFKPRKLAVAAKAMLMSQLWPGNVRELQNTLMRAAVWSQHETIDRKTIEDAILPATRKSTTSDSILDKPLCEGFDLEEVIGKVARHYLGRALKESGGNKTKASKLLNFDSYQRLDGWLKKYC